MTKQEQQKEFLDEWMNENLSQGFKNGELMTRLCIFQLGNNEYKVIWSSHHLLCDGWERQHFDRRIIPALRNYKCGNYGGVTYGKTF